MQNPKTVYEVLQLLEDYHRERLTTYLQLSQDVSDSMAQILLERLVELEGDTLLVVRGEMKQLDPQHAVYMTSGPTLSREVIHAKTCRCGNDPSFRDTLGCALESDHLLDQLLHRLEGCSAAASVLGLAERLRELEETKERQIANFIRME